MKDFREEGAENRFLFREAWLQSKRRSKRFSRLKIDLENKKEGMLQNTNSGGFSERFSSKGILQHPL